MLVDSNASPLILLARIDLLEILPRLFDRVLIPRAVLDETLAGGEDDPGSRETYQATWLEIVEEPGEQPVHLAFLEHLNAGEAATISLAQALRADLVLIDERQGRKIAQRLGLRVKGTIGVLVAARREGLVPQLEPLLMRLREEGAWVSDLLINEALVAVGEDPLEGPAPSDRVP